MSAGLETRSIDFVPYAERYGTPRSLFTLWFSSNLTILGVSVGTLGISSGLSLSWTLVALALGNAVGTLFMAAHSAQGPHLGIPQMIQSRAQFGVLGAGIPLIAVVLAYLLYCAANNALVASSVVSVIPVSSNVAASVFAALTLCVAFAGYRFIHFLGGVMSIVSPIIFVAAFFLLLARAPGINTSALVPIPTFNGAGFAAITTQAAAWALSYGPYVADYSRYLPPTTSAARTFWYTAAGCFGGSTLIMGFGAFITATFGAAPSDLGGTVANLFGPFSLPARLLIIVGVIGGNVMNLYSAYISMVTIFSGIHRRSHVSSSVKLGVLSGLSIIALLISQSVQDTFQQYLSDMLSLLIYLITPWSAINLADYYFVRKGRYRIEDMYRVDGSYGAFQGKTVAVYFLGVAAQLPFVLTSVYKGPIAARIGMDLAWIPGLAVPAVLYLTVARVFGVERESVHAQ